MHRSFEPVVPYPISYADAAARRKSFVNATVSCVLPGLNECENLRAMLPALKAILERVCEDWEVIVADGGSTDGTEALMAEWAGGRRLPVPIASVAGLRARRRCADVPPGHVGQYP